MHDSSLLANGLPAAYALASETNWPFAFLQRSGSPFRGARMLGLALYLGKGGQSVSSLFLKLV